MIDVRERCATRAQTWFDEERHVARMIASVFLPVFTEHYAQGDGGLLRRPNVQAERRKDVGARDGVFSGPLCVESERGEEHQRARQHGLGHATMYWRARPAVTGNRMG